MKNRTSNFTEIQIFSGVRARRNATRWRGNLNCTRRVQDKSNQPGGKTGNGGSPPQLSQFAGHRQTSVKGAEVEFGLRYYLARRLIA
jgi:hypothetical protein